MISFERGHIYKKVDLDKSFPSYLIENLEKYKHYILLNGEMAEWLKAHAWKACKGFTLSWVRIPFSPPILIFLKEQLSIINKC